MPQVEEAKTATESYFAEFARLKQALSQPAWLEASEKAAIETFARLGFPDTHQEAWRFTNVSHLAQRAFRRPAAENGIVASARDGALAGVERAFFEDVAARLVVVDGHFSARLSSVPAAPDGLRVMSLRKAIESAEPGLEEHLSRYAKAANQAFVALNTAFIDDGAFVEVARGCVLEKPVHLIYVRTAASDGTVTHPRNLILVGRDAQALVIETYLGLGEEEGYFTNTVTELVAGENASLEHVKLQEESEQAFHISQVIAHQERSSRFLSHSISLGARLARHDIRAVLAGEGAECTLNGLYQVRGRQHVDHHTTLDHAMPHCGSREYYRGVLDDHASGVFNGAIIVRKDAQKTDAIQSNKNLLLSEEATINTKPELQILADDVRCTHGATVGQLDPDAIFYLRARGIGIGAARHLLTRAFANDVIARIHFAPARQRLEAALLARLSAGWKPEEIL
jgi:Fe-S cluster assembly protein SufD